MPWDSRGDEGILTMWIRILDWWYGDPAKVKGDRKKWEVIEARSLAGLKPWPNIPDTDYMNHVNGTCGVCKRKIYGGEAISSGPGGTRCERHFP